MNEIKHGFLGKWNTYKNKQFKEVPPTTEERAKEIAEKLKPWVYDPEKLKLKFVGGYVESGGPTPPPVETYHLTDESGNPLLTEGGDYIDFDYV